ncbi:5151_t:CDS:1, partial [Racocetra persica]
VWVVLCCKRMYYLEAPSGTVSAHSSGTKKRKWKKKMLSNRN